MPGGSAAAALLGGVGMALGVRIAFQHPSAQHTPSLTPSPGAASRCVDAALAVICLELSGGFQERALNRMLL